MVASAAARHQLTLTRLLPPWPLCRSPPQLLQQLHQALKSMRKLTLSQTLKKESVELRQRLQAQPRRVQKVLPQFLR